jgi:hypothetical protein
MYNDNQSVLFNGKFARVDVEGQSTQWQAPTRQPLPRVSNRKDKKLGDDIADREGWLKIAVKSNRQNPTKSALLTNVETHIAQAEELIDAGEQDHEHGSEGPGAEGSLLLAEMSKQVF